MELEDPPLSCPYMSGMCSGGLAWQDFYGVYVHARPSYRFPATSFFRSYVIEDRINVAWGSWDIVSHCCSQCTLTLS